MVAGTADSRPTEVFPVKIFETGIATMRIHDGSTPKRPHFLAESEETFARFDGQKHLAQNVSNESVFFSDFDWRRVCA